MASFYFKQLDVGECIYQH